MSVTILIHTVTRFSGSISVKVKMLLIYKSVDQTFIIMILKIHVRRIPIHHKVTDLSCEIKKFMEVPHLSSIKVIKSCISENRLIFVSLNTLVQYQNSAFLEFPSSSGMLMAYI